MSSLERKIKFNISNINYYTVNQNTDYRFKANALSLINETYILISENLITMMKTISSDFLIELGESALQFPETLDTAEKIVKIFFDIETTKNNFYIRALLIKAQVEAKNVEKKNLKAEDAITQVKLALVNVQKSIELIAKPENKQKYGYLIYNSSIITFNILKKYFKSNWSKNFWEIIEKLSNFMEEIDDIDYNWRLRFLVKLAQCLTDADKKPEGSKALDKIADLLKKKGESEFQEELFRYRIHLSKDNTGALGNIKKEADGIPESRGYKYIYTLQCIKTGVIPENAVEKEIQSFIGVIYPDFFKVIADNSLSIKIDPWRADLLAEAGYLCIRSKLYSKSFILNLNFYNKCLIIIFSSCSEHNGFLNKIEIKFIKRKNLLREYTIATYNYQTRKCNIDYYY